MSTMSCMTGLDLIFSAAALLHQIHLILLMSSYGYAWRAIYMSPSHSLLGIAL